MRFRRIARLMLETTTIIGIDCATKANKMGLALADLSSGRLIIRQVMPGDQAEPSIPKMIGRWIQEGTKTLLALDAPLGWPSDMGLSLAEHTAGQQLAIEPDKMFRRLTDRFVKDVTGKSSLDVGADRIARTAHSALDLLSNIRMVTSQEIPLEWSPGSLNEVGAIEVYPALSLLALDLSPNGYKQGDTAHAAREKLLNALKQHIDFDQDAEGKMIANADLLDAVLCVKAGADFLSGKCRKVLREDDSTARKEGWIWFTQSNTPDNRDEDIR